MAVSIALRRATSGPSRHRRMEPDTGDPRGGALAAGGRVPEEGITPSQLLTGAQFDWSG